ncbi:Gfo/Idh/MocA family oxidoreductase, partial [Burkholderia sp. SIMBA_057]
IADPALSAVEALASRLGITKITTDAADVLNDPHVDAILIAAPARFHSALIAEAARAGKHVFCEKPGGRTMEELDQQEGDLERAQELMAKHNALKDTVERARHYGSIARDALGLFPDTPVKAALLEVLDFVIERDF